MVFPLFYLVRENRVNLIANSSSTFMWRFFSSSDYCLYVWTPLQTTSHHTREASVWIINFEFNWEKVRPLQKFKFSIHQFTSVLDLLLNIIANRQFIFLLDTQCIAAVEILAEFLQFHCLYSGWEEYYSIQFQKCCRMNLQKVLRNFRRLYVTFLVSVTNLFWYLHSKKFYFL